ncbi:MAG: TonB family protein [Muribaculaceae bacterium]|nr:TonB family protein [Muribaculaceae bacterium]
MKRGKHICETLKGIRSEIARANEIDYTPRECHHEGDCAGTCPACESEMRWLEGQLRLRQSLGKAVTIAGLSLGLASLSSCSSCTGSDRRLQDQLTSDGTEIVCDTNSIDNDGVREGEIVVEIQEDQQIDSNNYIYKAADVMAQYPKGEQALKRFIQEKVIAWQKSHPEHNIYGKVVIQCVIEKDGSIGEVKVVRSAVETLDRAAVEIVKELPSFIPAKNKEGKIVRLWYTLFIEFQPQK